MRVLIVDDSTFIRTNLKAFLEENGYDVVGLATNGESAIDQAFELKPDLITLDNILPDMTGMDILKAIRKSGMKIKVVMISAVGQQSAIVDAKREGADHYIVKPYDEKELLGILKELDEKR